ncbi:hypothetical protein ACH5A3_18465 [Streptomyces echinatus]|uniref:hypothetical protein n=1 Tax=Streptomyces echinatus TaxID=67293 RepID=UPI0037B4E467
MYAATPRRCTAPRSAALATARQALVEERHRRIGAGESVDQVAADAADRARRAFGPVEKGLKDYAVRT